MADTKPSQDTLSAAAAAQSSSGGAAGAPAAPTAEPPASVGISDSDGGTGGIGASTWVNNKKINALWSINENRNSWVGVAGVGWVKLANNSDTAIVAFTMLGANARLTQGNVNYRQEADN